MLLFVKPVKQLLFAGFIGSSIAAALDTGGNRSGKKKYGLLFQCEPLPTCVRRLTVFTHKLVWRKAWRQWQAQTGEGKGFRIKERGKNMAAPPHVRLQLLMATTHDGCAVASRCSTPGAKSNDATVADQHNTADN